MKERIIMTSQINMNHHFVDMNRYQFGGWNRPAQTLRDIIISSRAMRQWHLETYHDKRLLQTPLTPLSSHYFLLQISFKWFQSIFYGIWIIRSCWNTVSSLQVYLNFPFLIFLSQSSWLSLGYWGIFGNFLLPTNLNPQFCILYFCWKETALRITTLNIFRPIHHWDFLSG